MTKQEFRQAQRIIAEIDEIERELKSWRSNKIVLSLQNDSGSFSRFKTNLNGDQFDDYKSQMITALEARSAELESALAAI